MDEILCFKLQVVGFMSERVVDGQHRVCDVVLKHPSNVRIEVDIGAFGVCLDELFHDLRHNSKHTLLRRAFHGP